MQFVKRYQLKAGIFISLFVSLLVFIPRVIRYDESEHFYLLVQFAFFSFLFALSSWLCSQYFLKYSRIKQHWIKTMIAISFSMTVSVFLGQIYRENGPTLLYFKTLSDDRRTLMSLFRGLVIGGFTYLCAYYLNMLLETQKASIGIEHLKQENLQARLNSLKQQISPHFLFNSLNTLKSVANEEHVKEYVVQLSLVYRYLLNYNDNNLATVREELAFINAYSFILKERFEDGFSMQINIDDNIREFHIPTLSLQILIENAVKHNVASLSKPLNITISDNDGYIVVSNNLQRKFSSEENTGKGLINISDRYRLLARKTIDINEEEGNFTVKLPLLP
ncbi:hypothetical protein GO495_25495 [Chitinophaga oryziterrae]|uniref:Signal transduction histidine kinase internal region domain-containing protein n=1 Tax=Chitinophaga oryziterrae TaxID=1031224 RepID=A0A6N8JI14_9BACT|nr:histidine kinase [Chitinophaga oryziterrae]MVT43976.1 hypothetical protein [Chitinophaga oryziterrae]